MPALPAPGRVARGRGRRSSAPAPRRGLLGAAGDGVRGGPRRGSWSSAWRRRPTEATGPAGSSPATAPATGCSPRCTGPGSPTSRPPSTVGDGLRLRGAWVTAVNRCAPPANRPTTAERDNCLPYLERELALLRSARVIVALGSYAWDNSMPRADRARGRAAAPAPALRPRGRGRDRLAGAPAGPDAARLLPPEPAEHLHREADRADDGRRLRARQGPGRVLNAARPGWGRACRRARPCGLCCARVPPQPAQHADPAPHPAGAGGGGRAAGRDAERRRDRGRGVRAGGAHRRARRLHRALARRRSRPSAS